MERRSAEFLRDIVVHMCNPSVPEDRRKVGTQAIAIEYRNMVFVATVIEPTEKPDVQSKSGYAWVRNEGRIATLLHKLFSERGSFTVRHNTTNAPFTFRWERGDNLPSSRAL